MGCLFRTLLFPLELLGDLLLEGWVWLMTRIVPNGLSPWARGLCKVLVGVLSLLLLFILVGSGICMTDPELEPPARVLFFTSLGISLVWILLPLLLRLLFGPRR